MTKQKLTKTELKEKIIRLAREKIGAVSALDYEEATEAFAKNLAASIVARVPADTPIAKVEEVIREMVKEQLPMTKFPPVVEVIQKQRPAWLDELIPKKEILPKKKVDVDSSVIIAIGSILSTFLGALMAGLSKILNGVMKIMPMPEHYVTPQYVMIINPKTGQPMAPEDMGTGIINVAPAFMSTGGPTHVGRRGASSVNDGQETVTVAGTRVQLPDTPCSRVFVQAHPANGDLDPPNGATVVIGGNQVIAASATRRGLALFSTQWQEFQVDNLKRLYIDATFAGAKINYIYEI